MSGAPQVNGPSSPTGKFIDSIDPDDEDYKKNLRRPADVKEDIKQMSDRSRVSLILHSEAFRKELEEIVDEQIRAGNHPASLIALQQISDLLVPNNRYQGGSMSRGGSGPPVIPVSDIKGTDTMSYTKGEKMLRCKLAACYRLVDNNKWGHSIYNHITVRLNQDQEHFLINPFGLNYSEITASSLVKIDIQGEVIDAGTTELGVNQAGFTLHSAIHQFRPDIKCIIHLHTPSAVAVSGMKCGLLPLSQEALICGEVSNHDYNGILIDASEREALQNNLGPINKVMILRNHGIVACGSTIEEAYHYAFNVINACNAQVQAVPAGLDNLILVSPEIRQKTYNIASQGGGGVDTSGKKWKTGELEFEAQMRLLDNVGYRTGYNYKQPNVRREKRRDRSNAEVEVPPSSSSFTYVFDGDIEHSKYVSPIKAAMERQKQQHKVGWLNSPNVYVRQEMEEIGTQHPKKITKWVKEEGEEGSPKRSTGTPIKVDHPNQFAPQGSDPKEFREKQKQIKKDYYEERISAGPSSKVLEGISWEEAEKLKLLQANDPDGSLSATGDSVIVIGAASKGIIQRDQQHNVQVYKTQYAANPFENMSEEEMERYKFDVEHKGLDTVDEEESLEPGPEGKLISTEERIQQVQQKSSETTPVKTQVEVVSEDEPRKPDVPGSEASNNDNAFESVSSAASPPISPTSPVAPVVRRVKRPSQSKVNRNSRETSIDDLVPKRERRKSRETCVDDIFTVFDPSGDTNLDDLIKPTPKSRETSIDDISNLSSEKYNEPTSPEASQTNFQRSESARYPPKSPQLIEELKSKNFDRSKSERKAKNKNTEKAMNGDDDNMRSPAKSDTLRSTDSASGGDTLDDRSSKEGSPTKEHPSPTKEKKKKKKFRMPSFSKPKKSKDSKESSI